MNFQEMLSQQAVNDLLGLKQSLEAIEAGEQAQQVQIEALVPDASNLGLTTREELITMMEIRDVMEPVVVTGKSLRIAEQKDAVRRMG